MMPAAATGTPRRALVRRNKHGHLVHVVALTGGPCGGKSTGAVRLAHFFKSLGWCVLSVPETASLLIGGGIQLDRLEGDDMLDVNIRMVELQLAAEKTFYAAAECARCNVLVICDRAAMDPAAYMDADSWLVVMEVMGWHKADLLARYGQVVHMVTAADGASGYYTLANNAARTETPEQAVQRDTATRSAWGGHRCYDLVTNADTHSFGDKVNKLIQVVCDRIPGGVDYGDRLAPNSFKRKWLVRSVVGAALAHMVQFDLVHNYLSAADEQACVCKRGIDGQWSYTRTMQLTAGSTVLEMKTALSEDEYSALLRTNADNSRSSIRKHRCCFNDGLMYYQLDTYTAPLPPSAPPSDNGQLIILETYTTQTGDVDLPPFLRIDREITGEAQYSMFRMSFRGPR